MPEWTKKVARQHTRRRLTTVQKSLEECLRHWEDLDQSVVNEIEEAIGVLSDIEDEMTSSIEIEETEE